ncbi:hypothetical protein [Heyndrickxia coagulans]|jgi:uncharacterized membrane protein|uniref:hypothetical protein n=1 Tax=Heyndrickxia coagulans TaxID=1398 RepID=UPI001F2AEEF1|nr:hypothetical protein [Heyndrickxia coagulans]
MKDKRADFARAFCLFFTPVWYMLIRIRAYDVIVQAEKRGSSLGRVAFCFLMAGVVLFAAMVRHMLLYQKRRIYPPRKIIRKRIAFFGTAGMVFLLLAALFHLF